MDELPNYRVKKSTPRGVIRHFLEVAEGQDTPRQFTNQGVVTRTRSAQVSASKQRRVSGPSKGGRNVQSDVLHSQSKQSSSLMEKSMNVSLIQGINKTYSNIVAPDGNNSSINTSIDLAKAARFRTKKKRSKRALPPAADINKPLLRKKSRLSVAPAVSAGATTAPKAQDALDQPEKSSSSEAGAVENEMLAIPPENTSPIGRAEDTGHMSMSSDVSSVAVNSDGTYDFTNEYDDDDTLPYKSETERRFHIKTASNKLILPSLIEGLQAKQKSGGSAAVDKIALKVTSPEKLAQEAVEEGQNESYNISQNITDKISPPSNFRDVMTSRTEVLRAASFSDYLGESTPRAFHLEEKYENTSKDKLPETIAPVEDKDMSVRSQRRASAGQRKSVGQVTDSAVATPTPTRSAQRKGEGQVITPPSTAITPARSSRKKSQVITPTLSSRRNVAQGSAAKLSPRRSLGHDSTLKSSSVGKGSASRSSKKSLDVDNTVRSSPRRSVSRGSTSMSSPRSVGEVSAIKSSSKRSVGKVSATVATPTISPLQQNVSRNVTSVLVSPQKSDRVEETATVGRKGMSQAKQGGNKTISAELSPLDKRARRVLIYSEEDAHDSQEAEVAQSVPDAKEGNEMSFQSESEKGESPEKDATSKSLTVENALISDTGTEYSQIPVPEITVKRHSRSTLIMDVDEREKSLPNIQALPTPRKTPKEQSSAPSSTAKVRQMTMREFLEKLKTKPVQPPLTKPKPLLPSLLGDAVPSTSQPKSSLRPKHKKFKRKRVLPASLPPSLTKEVFTHFAKCRVTSGALNEVVMVTEVFWKNLTKDLCALHATKARPTKAIEAEDVEKLMKRQGLITSEKSLSVLVEELLPMETWSLFMPLPEPARNPFPSFNDLTFSSKKFADLDDD